jgi:hypothetical protein
MDLLSFVLLQVFEDDHFASSCRVLPLCDACEGQFSGGFFVEYFHLVAQILRTQVRIPLCHPNVPVSE